MVALFSKSPPERTPRVTARRRTPVTTYYRAQPNDQSPSPFKKKPVRKNRRKYLFGFLDIILVIALLLALAYSLGVKTQPRVLVNTADFHSLKEYSDAAANLFGQFKNRNKLTFDEQAVANGLQKRFPEISDVKIELPFFSEQATIRLTVAQPSFQLNSHGAAYVVSANGIITARVTNLPQFRKLPAVIDQSGFKAAVGQPVLSTGDVAFIDSVIAECRHAKVPIASLILPATPQELDLRTADQSYFVKFYLGGDVLDETGQFFAARQHFQQTGQPPSQYLDVRVSGKIFYK